MFGCMKIIFYIIGCLSFSSCWYPFPNAYERSMQAGRFHPDINTQIDEKVNIDGYYRIDFEDFEEKILDQGVKLFIL